MREAIGLYALLRMLPALAKLVASAGPSRASTTVTSQPARARKYDEATPLYKESLAIKKKVLGEEHPSVATGLNNLALLLSDQVRIFC